MRLKNKEIKGVVDTLFSIGNKVSDITLRWEIALISEPYLNASNLLASEINRLIKEQGRKDESGNFSLSTDNKDYQTLMECKTEADTKLIEVSSLQKYDLNMEELIALKPIIKGAD